MRYQFVKIEDDLDTLLRSSTERRTLDSFDNHLHFAMIKESQRSTKRTKSKSKLGKIKDSQYK